MDTTKEIQSVRETLYGFSPHYTVTYTDGTWEHVFYCRASFLPFLVEQA
mgnify:FL=1